MLSFFWLIYSDEFGSLFELERLQILLFFHGQVIVHRYLIAQVLVFHIEHFLLSFRKFALTCQVQVG